MIRSKLTKCGVGMAAVVAGVCVFDAPALAEQRRAGGAISSPFSVNPFTDLEVPEAADPAERATQAERYAQEGHRHFQDHQYEEAARALEVSYRLHPDPSLLYDLADALRRLGRYAAAAERLQHYLDEVGSELTPEQRGQLEQEAQELRSLFAAVTVRTEPEGASVLIGQRLVGVTPLSAPLQLNHGTYQLHVRLEGYREAEEELVVAGGRGIERFFRLEPLVSEHHHQGLDVALWVNVALSVVGVVAVAIIAAGAGNRLEESVGNFDHRRADVEDYASWETATWALTGVTSATGIAALVLGLIRLYTHQDEN